MTHNDMKQMELEGEVYNICRFIDDNGTEVSDYTQASGVVLQKPEDKEPDGVIQPYKVWMFPKGSLEMEMVQ